MGISYWRTDAPEGARVTADGTCGAARPSPNMRPPSVRGNDRAAAVGVPDNPTHGTFALPHVHAHAQLGRGTLQIGERQAARAAGRLWLRDRGELTEAPALPIEHRVARLQ